MVREIVTTAGNTTQVEQALADGFTIVSVVKDGPYNTYIMVKAAS